MVAKHTQSRVGTSTFSYQYSAVVTDFHQKIAHQSFSLIATCTCHLCTTSATLQSGRSRLETSVRIESSLDSSGWVAFLVVARGVRDGSARCDTHPQGRRGLQVRLAQGTKFMRERSLTFGRFFDMATRSELALTGTLFSVERKLLGTIGLSTKCSWSASMTAEAVAVAASACCSGGAVRPLGGLWSGLVASLTARVPCCQSEREVSEQACYTSSQLDTPS